LSRPVAVLAAGAAMVAVVAAPAAASPGPRTADSVAATGYHFQTFRDADVVAGSTGNNLEIAFRAGSPLTDGTVAIALPVSQWRTPLRAGVGLRLEDTTADGAVVVRPTAPDLPEPTIDPAAACGSPAATPVDWTVRTVLGQQLITVRHVNCDRGQQLTVRIKGVTAPAAVGRYPLPVIASDPGRLPRLSVATVAVVPTPRVALQLTAPAQVVPGVPFLVQIRAVRPDGATATGYRGAVAVVAEDQADCTLVPRDQGVAYQFTAADAGTAAISVMLSQDIAHRLRVYDIANKAVAGVVAPLQVVGPPFIPGLICPASYH
jgi:hypothetical protein